MKLVKFIVESISCTMYIHVKYYKIVYNTSGARTLTQTHLEPGQKITCHDLYPCVSFLAFICIFLGAFVLNETQNSREHL